MLAAIPLPPKTTLDEHVATQRVYMDEELAPAIEQARQGKIHLYFVDAAHFVLGNFLCNLWCVARLFIRSGCGRQRFNVLGAWNAITGQLVTVTNTKIISALEMCELMGKLALAHAGGAVMLVLDNARYQKCKLVAAEAERLGIILLYLPAYSPNFNLIERLWKHVRKHALYGKHFAKFADFQARITQCLYQPTPSEKAALSSTMTLNFQTFDKVSIIAA